MKVDISWQKVPLPDDLLQLKQSGQFDKELELIDTLLEKYQPKAMRLRLQLEKQIIHMIRTAEYPFTFEQACAIMAKNIEGFQPAELEELRDTSATDWIYIDGQEHFQRRFFETLVKTQPQWEKRCTTLENGEVSAESKNQMLNDNILQMEAEGGRKVRVQLKATVKAQPQWERAGEEVLVHLPLPNACQQNSQIKILSFSPDCGKIDHEEAPQRTISFKTKMEPGQVFSVEYAYTYHIQYQKLDPEKAEAEQPDFSTEEQAPHILFTPFLQEVLAEILGEETNPVRKARAIYDFVTTRIMYSYMREYATLDNISEYAAKNLKGDCGVQAILFITLCRMAGIPARWQSGLYVSPYYTGCHDWAQFYIAPYGWVWADLSFGGSSYRAGEMDRWNYYFGNLDVFRMVANTQMQAEFTPPKSHYRADPVDNQRGEIEYNDTGLLGCQMEFTHTLVSMEDIK